MVATREIQLISVQNQALQNGQLISRIFTDAAGRSFRLTFFVSIIDGEAKGQLVSAQEIGKTENGKKETFCLPCAPAHIFPSFILSVFPSAPVSPYFSLDFLINSQPTRAPAAK